MSLISVIIYRNMNYDKIAYYIKTTYPQVYVKMSELNYDTIRITPLGCSHCSLSLHYV